MAIIKGRLFMFNFCPLTSVSHLVSPSVCYKDTDVIHEFPCVTCENVMHGKLQKGDYGSGLMDRQH